MSLLPVGCLGDIEEDDGAVLALLLLLAVREAFITDADDIAGMVLAEKDTFAFACDGGGPGGSAFFLVITMLLLLDVLELDSVEGFLAEDESDVAGVPVGWGGFCGGTGCVALRWTCPDAAAAAAAASGAMESFDDCDEAELES